MSGLKTQPTDASIADFVASVDHAGRRADADVLIALLSDISGEPPTMWGPSIVGFGRYRYRYDSGHEGEAARIGFSPRKAHLVLYIAPGFQDHDDLLARLGNHKRGASCLYINRLSDVDVDVLRELAERSWAWMGERYATTS